MSEYIETTARWGKRFVEIIDPNKENGILRVYYEPPKREWVGLTDEDIWSVLQFRGYKTDNIEIAKAIEAKLKEKNT